MAIGTGKQKRKWFTWKTRTGATTGMWSDDPTIHEIITPLRQVGDTAEVRLINGDIIVVLWDHTPPEIGFQAMSMDEPISFSIPPPVEKDEQISACLEAHRLIHGDRAKQYGNVHDNFGRWSNLCLSAGIEASPYDLAIIMALCKLARQANKHKRDNIVDAIGYLDLAQQLSNGDCRAMQA